MKVVMNDGRYFKGNRTCDCSLKEKFGEDAKLEEGDEVVFQLNNCVLIISIEDNTMKQKFIGGQPIKIDHTLKIYESEE